MDISKTRKVVVKHFSGEQPEPFVGQPQQFHAGSPIAAPHAVEQLLELRGSVIRHGVIFSPQRAQTSDRQTALPTCNLKSALLAFTECTATEPVRLGI
jgi:hypothetical protein